ncbi:methylmalonyl-CoA carboxyltransferase [candidate division WOR-3 bacterium]|nr:methylmalonyl-CoA carboxyltransferase [candidate division WOR-3 bacterium]
MKKNINELIQELVDRKEIVLDLDEQRAVKQHAKNKKTARERISLLLDKGSFIETDMLVHHRAEQFGMRDKELPGEGVVTGYGFINGRLVYVFSQDFTVFGGALGEMHALKIAKIQDLALKTGAPLIGINDSGGARIQEGVDSLHGYGQIFYRNSRSSGVIPQISVILGPCAGGAVYSPALTDFVFLVDSVSNMYITGPKVIKAVTAEDVSSEELGGAYTHNAISGNGHFIAQNEEECFEMVKKLISYIPSNNIDDPPYFNSGDDINRMDMDLRYIVPTEGKQSYDVIEVIKKIIDDGDFFEVQPLYAQNMVIGFARIAGISIGIVANQPKVLAGCLDINSSDKAARFIRFCDAFNIPIVTFVDTPGFLPGKTQEFGGIIRHGAKLLYAYSEATVPKINITLRKSYGGASVAMCNKDLGADFVMAWPQAEIAVMGADGAVDIIFNKAIQATADPVKKRKELIDEYTNTTTNPYEAAKRGLVDMVILPEETRMRLASALSILVTKQDSLPAKKHDNMPL